MLFDSIEERDTKEEIEAAQQEAARLVRLWDRRAIFSGAALLFTCAAVYPFLAGHSLHEKWDAFGKHLVQLAMVLLPVALYCSAIAFNTRMYRRDISKLESDTASSI